MRKIPFTIRLLLATLLARQNLELLAEITYLRAEVDYYRDLAPPGRRRFTAEWRRRFAEAGAAIGWTALHGIATVAKAETIRRWHCLLKAGKVVAKAVGRPRTSAKIEALIIRMAKENQWGQIRISGELKGLGHIVCPRTVAAILRRHGFPSGPRRFRAGLWKPFITEHAHEIVATDFFTWDVWSWLGKKTIYVLFAIHLGTRRVHIMGMSEHPDERFMMQTARNVTAEGGWMHEVGAKRIIFDMDTKYCESWGRIMEEGGVKRIPLPEDSPNLNAFAERWVRSVKTEMLRKVIVLGEGGLRHVMDEYVRHFNSERPHQGIKNTIPAGNPPMQKVEEGGRQGAVRCRTRLGGVLKHYYRAA
jgi:transposase InsO family protein